MIKKSRHRKVVTSYILLSGCVCACVCLGGWVRGWWSEIYVYSWFLTEWGFVDIVVIFHIYSNEIRQKVTYYVTEMVSLLGNKLFLTDKNLFSLYCTNCIDILLNKQSHRSRNHVVYDSVKKYFKENVFFLKSVKNWNNSIEIIQLFNV